MGLFIFNTQKVLLICKNAKKLSFTRSKKRPNMPLKHPPKARYIKQQIIPCVKLLDTLQYSFTEHSEMAHKLCQQIMTRLCECIIQSRIDVSKDQIKYFNQFITQFQKGKEKAFKGNLQLLLASLIKIQRKQIREKVATLHDKINAVILFEFVERHARICMEKWILTLEPRTLEVDPDDEIVHFTGSLFEELLFFLTNQPLFKQYIKDDKMKQLYKLHYNLYIDSEYGNLLEDDQLTIHNFPVTHYRARGCENFRVRVTCFSVKSVYEVNLNREVRGRAKIKPKKEESRIWAKFRHSAEERKLKEELREEFVDLSKGMQRKHSLYEVYDADLECTLLSVSQDSFSSSPQGSVKQIKFHSKELGMEQDQFQLLKISPDEQFLNQNKKFFKDLSQLERNNKNFFSNKQ